MLKLTAPHLEEWAIERYLSDAIGAAQTPALRATRVVRHRGRVYVLVRRPDGETLAIYREGLRDGLKLVARPPQTLLRWAKYNRIDPDSLWFG